MSSGLAKRQPVRTNTTILGFAEGAMQKDLTSPMIKKTVHLVTLFRGSGHLFGGNVLATADTSVLRPNLHQLDGQ